MRAGAECENQAYNFGRREEVVQTIHAMRDILGGSHKIAWKHPPWKRVPGGMASGRAIGIQSFPSLSSFAKLILLAGSEGEKVTSRLRATRYLPKCKSIPWGGWRLVAMAVEVARLGN